MVVGVRLLPLHDFWKPCWGWWTVLGLFQHTKTMLLPPREVYKSHFASFFGGVAVKSKKWKCSIWTGTLTSGEGKVWGRSREGVVLDFWPWSEGRGQMQNIGCSSVATCNPTVRPVSAICLDRCAPSLFTKRVSTGTDEMNKTSSRKEGRTKGWEEEFIYFFIFLNANKGKEANKAPVSIHKPGLAGSLSPPQQFIEGSMPSIKGFFPHGVLTPPM